MEGTACPPQSRRWWQKKRWLTAGLLWLGLGYVLTEGPATYAVVRGWLPLPPVRVTFLAADLTVGRTPLLAEVREAYLSWWNDLGSRHRPRVVTARSQGWEIVLSSDVEHEGVMTTGWPDRDTFSVRIDGHEVVVENGRETPADEVLWDGPVLLDGRPIAVLPKGTRRLSLGYFDGELSIEADGVEAETPE